MARFPYYKRNIAALGKLLADARLDPAIRAELSKNPNKLLAEIGLPDNVTQLVEFEVVDPADENAVVLPYRLNQERLDRKDPEYLTQLSNLFSDNKLKDGFVAEEKTLN